MKHLTPRLAIILLLSACSAEKSWALITIDTVTVGNAGNPNDTTGYGAVDYDYAIGKYEVTLNQYSAFLNAVAAMDTYGLYNPAMATDLTVAGITRSGVSGSYHYNAGIGNGNRPVTYVSWFDAARFANWLQNGQPAGAQTAATTESGAYDLFGATSGTSFTRSAGTTYGLPSENEWYKAAYHDPSASSQYWLYPTRSAAIPNSRDGSVTDPNSANFYRDDAIGNGYNAGYAVSGNTSLPFGQNFLMPVGSYTAAFSPYGTFDQGGNVDEWNDAVISGSARGFRGGSWYFDERGLRATWRNASGDPNNESIALGFRIVIVPEPTAVSFALLCLALLLGKQMRSKNQF